MSKAEELSKLFELKKQGILSEEEFNQEKAKLLSMPVASAVAPSPAVQSVAVTAPTPGQISSASNFASCSMIQMSCPKCKGEVQFLPGLDVLRCTFCGAEISVKPKESTVAKIPDQLLPFCVSAAEAKKRFFDHLADDDYVPDDIFKDKNAISVFGLYCPAYLFNGKFDGNWTALSIVKYTVKRGDKTTGEEEQANPISGSVKGPLNYVVVASKIASGTPINAEDLRVKLKPYQPEFVQGFLVESITSAKSQEACEVVLRTHAREVAEVEAIKMMPTSEYRNLAVNVDATANATAFLQPLWGCDIKHGDTAYRLWLPSQSAVESISGELPQDPERINLSEKLKKAGNTLYGVAGVVCCGAFLGLIGVYNHLGSKEEFVWLPFLAILVAAPIAYKASRKSKAGEADLSKALKQSKERRRSNMPRV
jgi:hypothetical protein